MKVGIIGAGYWGKNLVRVFNELGALKTICDSSLERKAFFKDKYPKVKWAENYSDILEDPEIEGVIIATPAITHFDVAQAALIAGKGVFVEKPLALTVAQGEALVNLAEEKKLTLAVGHVLHYHPSVVKMKELISAGEIGRLEYIYSNRLNLGKFRNEENILWSFAPHDISLILNLIKEFPTRINCVGGSYLHKKIADVTLCSYEFESGKRAHIFVSWLHPTKEQKLVVVGSNGMIVFDDTLPPDKKLALFRHEVIWLDGVPNPKKNDPEFPEIEWSEPLKNECQSFLNALSTGKKLINDGREGLETLKLLNHSQESLESGNPVEVIPGTNQAKKGSFFIHQTSFKDPSAQIGSGTKIWHFSHIMGGVKIGSNSVLGQNVFVGKNVKIGSNVKIQNNVSVYEAVHIEDGVFVGPSVVFTNVFNPRSEIERKTEFRKTHVGTGTSIGANATIVCGVKLGEYSFIGAGAVVTKDVAPFSLVYGNPSRLMGWMSKTGKNLGIKPEEIKSKPITVNCDGDSYKISKDIKGQYSCQLLSRSGISKSKKESVISK